MSADVPQSTALTRSVCLTSRHPPDALRAHLETLVEPLDGGFTLMSRLSGGGIVTRTLRAPDTERPLFGRVTPERIRVALVHRDVDMSPFQPIATVRLDPDGGGSRVTLELGPHPNARSFGGIFAFGAALLLGASLFQFSCRPVVAVSGMGFAVLLAVFPHLRARHGFGQDADRAVAVLTSLLELEP